VPVTGADHRARPMLYPAASAYLRNSTALVMPHFSTI
jgi:hypothetical protein